MILRHAGVAVYDLPGWVVALGVGASVVSVLGWLVLARTGGWFGLATAVLGGLIVASIVTIPVVGVILLVVGIAGLAQRKQQSQDRFALAAGLVLAIAVPAAALVAADGPVVACGRDGVRTTSSVFRPGTSSSGTGNGTGTGAGAGRGWSPAPEDGVIAGTVRTGDRTYTYRCTDGRLKGFTARTSGGR